jgi:hypothetical protein
MSVLAEIAGGLHLDQLKHDLAGFSSVVAGFAAWVYLSGTAAGTLSGATLEAKIRATIGLTRAAAKVADTTRASSTQSSARCDGDASAMTAGCRA